MLCKLTGCPDVRRGSTGTGSGCHHCLYCSSASCCANPSKLRGPLCLSMLLFMIFLSPSMHTSSFSVGGPFILSGRVADVYAGNAFGTIPVKSRSPP